MKTLTIKTIFIYVIIYKNTLCDVALFNFLKTLKLWTFHQIVVDLVYHSA